MQEKFQLVKITTAPSFWKHISAENARFKNKIIIGWLKISVHVCLKFTVKASLLPEVAEEKLQQVL